MDMIEERAKSQIREVLFDESLYDRGGYSPKEDEIALSSGVLLRTAGHVSPREDDSLYDVHYQFLISGLDGDEEEEFLHELQNFVAHEIGRSPSKVHTVAGSLSFQVQPKDVVEASDDLVFGRLTIGDIKKRCLVNKTVFDDKSRERYFSHIKGKLSDAEQTEAIMSGSKPRLERRHD